MNRSKVIDIGTSNKNFEKVARKNLTKIKNGKDFQGFSLHCDDDPNISQEYVEGVIDKLCENMIGAEGRLVDWRNNVDDMVKVMTWCSWLVEEDEILCTFEKVS